MVCFSADDYVRACLHAGILNVGVVGSSSVPAFKPIGQEALWSPVAEEDRGDLPTQGGDAGLPHWPWVEKG